MRPWQLGICFGLLCLIPHDTFGQSLPAPLTKRERVHEYLVGLASPISVISSAAAGGIGQWRDRPREWDQGASGYAARFASSFGQHVVQQTILSGTAAIAGEETRYLPSGIHGFKRRLKYALLSTVMTREEDGLDRPSISKIAAFAGGSLLSRAWQPPSTATAQDAVVNMAASVGAAAGINVVHEFLPRIFRMLR